MKALTLENSWYQFEMSDLPTLFSDNKFALLGKENSPLMYIDTIRRGDRDSGLYEGDVIRMNDDLWVVCYERGFYAINTQYITTYLDSLSDYEFIGVESDVDIPIPINYRLKHLFKYKDTIFRLNDIVGAYKGKLLLRSIHNPVDVSKIQQECCMVYNHKRIYLGDTINGNKVVLKYGRIILSNGKDIQLLKGG